MTVIYDDQTRDYYNPQTYDLDQVLYRERMLSSPNVRFNKFIFLFNYGVRRGCETFEELIKEVKEPFEFITATQ